MSLDVYGSIATKRDGGSLPADAWRDLVEGFLSGEIAEYQMSALLMAIAIRGMAPDELTALTEAMIDSGARLDLSRLAPLADKHSTGGVGDKTTLVVAPLVAACGVRVAKMSGRGLGHTGGTIDKLEAIPGMRVELSPAEFEKQVDEVGVAVIAQRDDLAPADKALYALRDVTATVESVPLIAASIVSKKVAAGAPCVVFDVKTGGGAFLREANDAILLGRTLVRLAESFGLAARAMLTAMDQPLGLAVGNALEVKEAIACLKGEGPPDLAEVAVAVATQMVALATRTASREAGETVLQALHDRAALACFETWVRAQGGDPRVVEDASILPRAPVVEELRLGSAGVVHCLEPVKIARAAARLGAGRAKIGEHVDPAVGVECLAKVGDSIGPEQIVARLHARSKTAALAVSHLVREAYVIGEAAIPALPVILADPLQSVPQQD